MKERPILFSDPMVRALIAGTKTQTRRAIKAPDSVSAFRHFHEDSWDRMQGIARGDTVRCPYGQPGDRLWVRETFAHLYRDNIEPASRHPEDVAYKADGLSPDPYVYGNWKPSIHMPRWASRITLEVTGVRVERLQDISEKDAIAEGLIFDDKLPEWGCWYVDESAKRGTDYPVDAYRDLWEQINGPGSWDANPWVWVVEFKRLEAA